MIGLVDLHGNHHSLTLLDIKGNHIQSIDDLQYLVGCSHLKHLILTSELNPLQNEFLNDIFPVDD